MKKLKERFGYYFEFKNTINGTDYFMRGLAGVLFIIPMAIFIGIGVALLETSMVVAGFLFLLGSLFFIYAVNVDSEKQSVKNFPMKIDFA